MALFDPTVDPFVDVATPQGSMRLPTSVANALGLTPAQPLAIDTGRKGGTPSSPDPTPTPMPQPTPTPPPQPAPGPASGQSTLGPRGRGSIGVNQLGQNEVPAMPAAAPARPVAPAGQGGIPTFSQDEIDAINGKAPAQPAPARQPAPTTAGDLRKTGIGGALDTTLGALGDQAQAGKDLADAQAKQQLAFANEYDKRNQHIDDMIAQRAKDAQDRAVEIDSRIADYDDAVKKYANTKIDRSVDHPILAAISLALGAFGSAMKGSGENPALNVLFQQIDRKVQGQMADQAKLGQVASMKRSDIDLLNQKATNSTARYNMLIAGETQKAANQIEAIGARSQSDIVRANAAQAAALLREKASNAVGSAVMAQLAQDDKDKQFAEQLRHTKVEEGLGRANVGLGYANLNERRYEFGENQKLQRDQLKLEADKLAAAGKQAEAKALQDRGIGGVPVPVKDAAGNIVGVKQDILRNKDGSAFLATGSPEAVSKLIDQKAATDTVVHLLDEAIKLRTEKGWSSDLARSKEWQQLRANWGLLKAKEKDILALGALSGDDYKLLNETLGTGDPTQFRDPLDGMKQARKNAVLVLNDALHAHGLDGDYQPPNLAELEKPPITETDEQFKRVIGNPARGDNLLEVAGDLGIPQEQTAKLTAPGVQQLINGKLEEQGGVLPSQRSALEMYAQAMNDPQRSDKERTQAREFLSKAAESAQVPGVRALASQLMSGSLTSSLPSPTESVGGPARASAPDQSYGGRAQTVTAQQQVIRATPLKDLATGAAAGDMASKQEIVRRAAAGDKQAQAVAADLVKAKR
jgi:hypothetical protein